MPSRTEPTQIAVASSVGGTVVMPLLVDEPAEQGRAQGDDDDRGRGDAADAAHDHAVDGDGLEEGLALPAPILSSGHSEVREIEVALRNDEVTSTIITMVKAMNRLKPALPRVLRATSAIDLPPSRMTMNSVVKSWTAPMKTPPKTTQSQAGTKP